jgi:iron complex transport system permease protein
MGALSMIVPIERGITTRPTGWIWGSAMLFAAAAFALPWIGPGSISIDRVLAKAAPDYPVFIELRVSRTLLGLLAGGALALTGSLFQAMMRDSLASPYTLGVSAGAALGAVTTIALDLDRLLGFPAAWAGAMVGAAAVMAIVAGASWKRGQLSGVRLLLSGIALNSICTAFILLINSVIRDRRTFSITQWLLGSVDAVSYRALFVFAAVVSITSLIVITQARDWNLLAVGETWAGSRGTDLRRLTIIGYCCGSVLTAGAIALTGPIGFVGLIVPHMVRSRISPDNRILMPCSLLLGGVLLASCDTIGRVVMAPAELPAGAVMALIGGPYLVGLVRRRF